MTTDNERRETPEDEDDIVIVDNAPEPDAPKPKKPRFEGLDDGDETYGAKVQKRIAQLSRRNRETESRANAALARADAAERALLQLRRDSLTATDAAYDRDFRAAQDRAKRAYTEADAEAATDANAEMARIAAARQQVKRDIESTPQAPAPRQQVTYTPDTQAFIDENPWFIDDPDARDLATTLHRTAERRGLKVDTPAYFKFIADGVFKQFPEHAPDGGEDGDGEVEVETPAAPVARARRSVPGAKPVQSNRLPPLTKDEADQARRMGLTLKEFAQSKAQLIAAGKIGK